MKPYRLYALPSAWSGAARLLDLGGTFDAYNVSSSAEDADTRAIATDWTYVGRDLFRAARSIAASLGLR